MTGMQPIPPAPAPDYLNPNLPRGLATVRIPVVEATAQSLQGYGVLVHDPKAQAVEIVRWPSQGWRPVDVDSGNEGGTTRGTFVSEWEGDILYGRNDAVGGHYILGYNTLPEHADTSHRRNPARLLLWHCNYHPDGGQMFFPLEPGPFLVPMFLVPRWPGPADAPQRLARRRLCHPGPAQLLRRAGRCACARFGELCHRVQLPA